PPDHDALRGLLESSFTPKQLASSRDRIQRTVDALLDRVAARGAMDFIRELAFPLPATVIAGLMGAPEEDLEPIKTWSDRLAAYLGGAVDARDNFAAARPPLAPPRPAPPPSRRGGAPARRPLAPPRRRRGAPALRRPRARHREGRDGGRPLARPDDSPRRHGRPLPGLGQPRPAAVSRPRHARPAPAPGAARGLRRRHPLLPRRVAGAPRGARRPRYRAPATAGAGARARGAALEADDLPPRARVVAAHVGAHGKAAV